MAQKPILTGVLCFAMALIAASFPAGAGAGDLEVTPSRSTGIVRHEGGISGTLTRNAAKVGG